MPFLKSASTTVIDQPPDTGPVIHNHYAPNHTGLFVVGVVTALGSLVLGWWVLVFLFDAAGFRHPQQMVASVILVLGVAALVSWGVSNWAGGVYLTAQERTHAHQQRMGELQLELARYRAMAEVRQLPTGRANENEQEWSRLILAVMSNAYNLSPFKPKDARPWVRDQVIEIAANSGIKVKHTQAAAVDSWLKANKIITDDRQISPKFPTLADVQQLLIKLYDRPIVYNGSRLDTPLSGEYAFIDEK